MTLLVEYIIFDRIIQVLYSLYDILTTLEKFIERLVNGTYGGSIGVEKRTRIVSISEGFLTYVNGEA